MIAPGLFSVIVDELLVAGNVLVLVLLSLLLDLQDVLFLILRLVRHLSNQCNY